MVCSVAMNFLKDSSNHSWWRPQVNGILRILRRGALYGVVARKIETGHGFYHQLQGFPVKIFP
jgi:hypothetical protein